jgi:ribosome-binding protein aMBF1 (putative translation factor)
MLNLALTQSKEPINHRESKTLLHSLMNPNANCPEGMMGRNSNEAQLRKAFQMPKSDALSERQKVGQFFRDRRLAAGLSVEHLASELGLPSPEVLTDFETGAQPIPLDTIFAMTNVLNIPPEDVIELIMDLYILKGQV